MNEIYTKISESDLENVIAEESDEGFVRVEKTLFVGMAHEIAELRAENERLQRDLYAYECLLETEKARAEATTRKTFGLVEIQKHRDDWRRYAYGRGEHPMDFLDGNMVESDRGPTLIEKLEADVATLRAKEALLESHNCFLCEAVRDLYAKGADDAK